MTAIVISFLIGLFVGVTLGVVLISLLTASRRNQDSFAEETLKSQP